MRRRHKELLVVASLGAVAAAGLVTFLLWAEREAADKAKSIWATRRRSP